MSFLFPKSYRLLLPKDFNNLKLSSKKKRNGTLLVYYRERSDRKNARMAISVSSKIYNSVQRNKIKRVIREGFRTGALRHLSIDILFVVIGQGQSENFEQSVVDLRKSFLAIAAELGKSIKISSEIK